MNVIREMIMLDDVGVRKYGIDKRNLKEDDLNYISNDLNVNHECFKNLVYYIVKRSD